MTNDNKFEIDPSFLFFKYKGILLPEEFEKKYQFYGFKCKKYSNWLEVYVSKDSKKILSSVGDSLLDKQKFPLEYLSEISLVWEKVQRWRKDGDNFSIEPDLTDGFEKFQRLITLASIKPEVVDAFITDHSYDCNSIDISTRWELFLSICLRDFILADKRVAKKIEVQTIGDEDYRIFILNTANALKNICNFLSKDINKLSPNKTILKFISFLGIRSDPEVTERSILIRPSSSNVIVEFFEGPKTEFIKFQELQGSLVIKLNKLHRSNEKNNPFKNIFDNKDFWLTVGEALKSHMGSIDEIQSFLDTLGKKIHLYKTR